MQFNICLGVIILVSWAVVIDCQKWYVPSEEDPIKRVWMAFPRSFDIWGETNLEEVQYEWSNLVKIIAKYKPIYALCDPELVPLAKFLVGTRHNNEIRYITTIPYNDIWMRDTGCVFRRNGRGGLECIKLNFNGWGNKQRWDKDGWVADYMAAYLNIPLINTDVRGEGGGVIGDGNGTLIANWASWSGHNRNPGKTRKDVGDELLYAYGAKKMIWFDGVVGEDITDDHIDCALAFIDRDKLFLNWPPQGSVERREAEELKYGLSQKTDAEGHRFLVIDLPEPNTTRTVKPKMLKTYINYLVIEKKAVITAEFGDPPRDSYVRNLLSRMYPGMAVEMTNVDYIYAGGGGIHCITQHEPYAT